MADKELTAVSLPLQTSPQASGEALPEALCSRAFATPGWYQYPRAHSQSAKLLEQFTALEKSTAPALELTSLEKQYISGEYGARGLGEGQELYLRCFTARAPLASRFSNRVNDFFYSLPPSYSLEDEALFQASTPRAFITTIFGQWRRDAARLVLPQEGEDLLPSLVWLSRWRGLVPVEYQLPLLRHIWLQQYPARKVVEELSRHLPPLALGRFMARTVEEGEQEEAWTFLTRCNSLKRDEVRELFALVPAKEWKHCKHWSLLERFIRWQESDESPLPLPAALQNVALPGRILDSPRALVEASWRHHNCLSLEKYERGLQEGSMLVAVLQGHEAPLIVAFSPEGELQEAERSRNKDLDEDDSKQVEEFLWLVKNASV